MRAGAGEKSRRGRGSLLPLIPFLSEHLKARPLTPLNFQGSKVIDPGKQMVGH